MSESLSTWASLLACPLDRTPLTQQGSDWKCTHCGYVSQTQDIGGQAVPDLRARDVPQVIAVDFRIPGQPLDRDQVAEQHFSAVRKAFPHYRKREIRRRFGTKLDKGIQYYCQQLWQERGDSARILDLGCGNGGNRLYLRSLGFRDVLTVDWIAAGADMLVDAHRLPLEDASFDLVISTAVFEHLYNPFLAMREVVRVLKPGGQFVGSASFWEAWHGSSYFHLSPDGWSALMAQNSMTLVDLWAGWGIVPASLSHVLTPGYLRGMGYFIQGGIEGIYRLFMGEFGVRKLQLRASGAYVVCGRKEEQTR